MAVEYKKVESDQNAFLYTKVYELIEQSGKFQIQHAEVMRKSVGDFLKYNVQAASSIKEAKNLILESREKYEESLEKLNAKKSKLFRNQDISTWQLNSNVAGMEERLLANKDEAFTRMLPEESAKVSYQREELEYFVNVMHGETKRMLHNDYEDSRDNFVDMGEMQMRFIHEYSSRWLDYVKYFSAVNDQRIDGEKKFMESN